MSRKIYCDIISIYYLFSNMATIESREAQFESLPLFDAVSGHIGDLFEELSNPRSDFRQDVGIFVIQVAQNIGDFLFGTREEKLRLMRTAIKQGFSFLSAFRDKRDSSGPIDTDGSTKEKRFVRELEDGIYCEANAQPTIIRPGIVAVLLNRWDFREGVDRTFNREGTSYGGIVFIDPLNFKLRARVNSENFQLGSTEEKKYAGKSVEYLFL